MRNRFANGVSLSALLAFLTVVLWSIHACKRDRQDQQEEPQKEPALPLEVLPNAQDLDLLPPEVREQIQIDLRAVKQRPEDAALIAKVAMMNHAYEFYPAAKAWYEPAVELAQQMGADRDAFVYRYYLADVHRRLGDLPTAIVTLNVGLARRPDDVHGRLFLAEMMHALNVADQVDQATRPTTAEVRRAYRQVLDRDSTVAPAHYGLGVVEFESGNFQPATAHLEEALRLAPDYLEARTALADVMDKLGDTEGARALRDQPPPDEPDNGYVDPYMKEFGEQTSHETAKLRHALGLLQQGLAKEAESYVRLMTLEDPSSAPAWDTLGTIELGRMASQEPALRGVFLNEAKKCFLEAIELDPMFHQARINYAVTMRLEGDIEAAVDTAREVVERDDEYWVAHYHLGEWLAQKAAAVAEQQSPLAAKPYYNESKQHYQRTIDLSPKNMFAYSGLARVLEIEGRYQEMHDLLRQAVRKQPQDPGVADQLARLLATSEVPSIYDPQEAVAISLRIVEVTEYRYPQYCETLAIAYEGIEDYDAALRAIKIAIDEAGVQKLDKMLPRLQERRARIEAQLTGDGAKP